MSRRVFHIIGDVIESSRRAAMQVAESVPVRPPLPVDPQRPIDVFRRSTPLEQAARDICDTPVSAVWLVLTESKEPDGSDLLGAVSRGDDGKPHIFLVLNRLPCPVLRVAVFHHEMKHIQRGDLSAPPVREALEQVERECDAAAERAIHGWTSLATKRSRTRVCGDACVECYRGSRAPCHQGAQVYEAVNQALSGY